ncbi:branched-chain amino acid ABC transporter permease [Candidatus Dependentiae bacterium]|nr:MAG: branched-chain amino acid ABC transporter permease [Candidatus Dependentiae bacterium]
MSGKTSSIIDPKSVLLSRADWHWAEALPWILAIAVFVFQPITLNLGVQILIMIIFALSLDLILGYGGVVTLGHAAYFGAGAYATGMLSAHLGWNEPISGLLLGASAAAIIGFLTGWVLMRYHGLALLMLTLALGILMAEFANVTEDWTGGFDGLYGISIDPIFGIFENDLWRRNYFWYCLIVAFVVFLACRRIVNSAFGRGLVGIRENTGRMRAIGSPVHLRLVMAYTISAFIAGIAGALFAQSNEYVTLDVLSFVRSGTVLIVLVLGGTGRLYGAFVGAIVYILVEDELAKEYPAYWELGLGFVLVLTALFFRDGLLGALESIVKYFKGREGGRKA